MKNNVKIIVSFLLTILILSQNIYAINVENSEIEEDSNELIPIETQADDIGEADEDYPQEAKDAGYTYEQYKAIMNMPDFPDSEPYIPSILLLGTNDQQAVVNKALSYLGVPYVYGGASPSGFDCSGLVQYVFQHAVGISLPRTAASQSTCGTAVSLSALELGDLLFWGSTGSATHVAIYIGNNQYVHAPKAGDVVKITNMSYYYPHFARRILTSAGNPHENPATVPNGIYQLRNVNSGKYLDLPNAASATNGTQVQQFENHPSPAQRWSLEQQSNGSYKITNAARPDLSLDSYAVGDYNGCPVDVYEFNNPNSQFWTLVRNNDGTYYVVPRCSQTRCLDVPGASTANGVLLSLWEMNGGNNQKWILELDHDLSKATVPNGIYRLRNINSGKYLDLPNAASATNGTQVQQFENHPSPAQRWSLEQQTNGSYKITNVARPDLSLDSYAVGDYNGCPVDVYEFNNPNSQFWTLVRNNDGTYCVVPRCSQTRCLDVPGASTANGVLLSLWEMNGGNNQRWVLENA